MSAKKSFQITRVLHKIKSSIPNIMPHMIYIHWAALYFIVSLIAFSLVITYRHSVIFYLPFNLSTAFFVLLGFSNIIFWINYHNPFYFKSQPDKIFLLFLSPFIILIVSMMYPLLSNTKSFHGDFETIQISSTYNSEVREQIFQSSLLIQAKMPSDTSIPYTDNKLAYIFYKQGCPYCKVGITKALSEISSDQKKQVMFVDLAVPGNASVANELGVDKAATLVTYEKGADGNWVKTVTRLAEGDVDHPTINQEAIELLEKVTGGGI